MSCFVRVSLLFTDTIFVVLDPLALRYMPMHPSHSGSNREVDRCGYLKVVIGCQYSINITL